MPLSYPEPPLTDDVVILRPWELKDLPVLEEASCDEYVSLVEQLPVPFDARRGQDWIARKHATFSGGDGCELAIAERESGDAIGGIGFVFRHVPGTAEAGYWIVERRRRQGFASCALEIFSRWALTSGGGVVRMQATVEPWNLASQRVLAKAGFLQEGRLRSYASWRGRREDVFMYSLLAEDLELTGVAGSRVTRTRPSSVDLGAAWEENASAFIAWARTPNHDSYWQFHRDVFLELLPPRGRRTLDLGCGEGRLSRDLKRLGHDIVGIDGSPTMVAAARDADAEIEVQLADAAALPFADGEFDLVVAFMSLQDIDDFAGAVRESARVLEAGGRLCLAIVHPLNSGAGSREPRPTACSRSQARTWTTRTTPTTSCETVSRSTSSARTDRSRTTPRRLRTPGS